MKYRLVKRTIIIVAVSFVFLILVFLIVISTQRLPHYPNAIVVEDCGNRFFTRHKTFWMLNLWTCYETSDSKDQVWEWYEEAGWHPFGARIFFPYWEIGDICFEIGNQFTLNQQENSTEIYESILYRIGRCPWPQ